MVLLHGRAGRLTAKNGGFRPGQSLGKRFANSVAEGQDSKDEADGGTPEGIEVRVGVEGVIETTMPAASDFAIPFTVRARPGRLSALSFSPSESVLCGAFCMGAQGA